MVGTTISHYKVLEKIGEGGLPSEPRGAYEVGRERGGSASGLAER